MSGARYVTSTSIWRAAASTPLRTIAQNGLDAWPCVTTKMRTASPLRPGATARPSAAAGGWPPVATSEDSWTVVVLPHAASSTATAARATLRRIARRRGRGTVRTTLDGVPGRRVGWSRAPAPACWSARGALDLRERLRAPLAPLADDEHGGRDEGERRHPDRPPERVGERRGERVGHARADGVGHLLERRAAAPGGHPRRAELGGDLVLEDGQPGPPSPSSRRRAG